MPPARFLLLLALVIAAAGLTVALGMTLAGDISARAAAGLGLAALALAAVLRLTAGRLR